MGQPAFGDKGAAACAAINLARVAPFRLGALDVSPATRQLQRGERRETLEPRIMQVLVALRRADGAVVSRDDLIAGCWDGRIVGDNAIQRTISRLRDIAEGIGSGCFHLETVNKVGYRLTALEPSEIAPLLADGQVLPAQRQLQHARRMAFAAAAVLVLVAAAVLIAWIRPSATAPMTIGIAAYDPGAAELGSGLAIDLAYLDSTHDAISFTERLEGARTDYLLTVARRRFGDRTQADLALVRRGSNHLLWSASFTEPANAPEILRQKAALAVSTIAECALDINNDAARTGGDDLRLVFSACDRLDGEPDDTTVSLWRRIAVQSPGNSRALATLAFVEAVQSTMNPNSAKSTTLRAAAREHVRRARALNDHLGLTYAADATLIQDWRYGDKLTTLARGLALDPDCAVLYALKSDALQSVGFMDDALAAARKAAELEPGFASYRASLALALAYNGFTGAANAALAAAERLWPDSVPLAAARVRYDFRFGDAAKVLHEIDSGRVLPDSPSVVAQGPVRAFLLARAQPSPENARAAADLAIKYSDPPHIALQSLAALGHVDQAYALLNDPRRLAGLREVGPYILFRANARALVLDRRFMDLANRLGLVQYWSSSKTWPDFCYDKDVPYNCKAEARRLHALNAS